MSNRAEKRKRVVLTLEEKLGVIQDRASGLPIEKIASKYNIGVSTVSEMWKRREDIEEAVEKDRMTGKIRKTLRESAKPGLESFICGWFHEQKERNINPTNSEIIEKAKEINATLRQEDESQAWTPSKSWMSKLMERLNVKQENTHIESEESQEIEITESQEIEQPLQQALEAAEFLLDYINNRDDFLLKDVITVRMIRDKLAAEQETGC